MAIFTSIFSKVHKSKFYDTMGLVIKKQEGIIMKVGIIGIGSVGGAVATAVHNTGLVHELVLIDRNQIRARGAAEDLGHAATFGWDIDIRAGTYRDLKGANIVIIAAGANQKPGETRMDLLDANAAVINDIVPQVMKYIDPKNTILIVVTNPLDVMVMLAQRVSKMDASRVIGTGTMLDSARLKTILSRQLGVSPSSVNAYVLGEHGDSSVINWSAVTIGNLPLDNFAKQTKHPMTMRSRDTITYRVKNAAYEILQGRGATWDGIGAAVADLIQAIVNNERRILTVSTVTPKFLPKAVALSLPRIVGGTGVSISLRPSMTSDEMRALRKSAVIIRKNFEHVIK